MGTDHLDIFQFDVIARCSARRLAHPTKLQWREFSGLWVGRELDKTAWCEPASRLCAGGFRGRDVPCVMVSRRAWRRGYT